MAYDGSIKIDTSIDGSRFKAGLSKISGLTKSAFGGMVKVIGGAAAALGAGAAAAVKVGSDFEAAMSKVSAISGATGSDLDALNAKAQDMGSKTKFSATESAEAFQYMAMAGWKTSDMLDGISGVMNLAAASGEDLAGVSDIVTDAITAFGLKASDSAHFADVLAKAASSSNTNVGLMGQTFKYAAPLAGAMGYSIEDTATAIGLMANAGIKGEQAGTSLRSIFTRLADPPKDAAKAIEKLGLQVTDTNGKALPLADVMDQLRDKFAGLSDAQKTQMASALGGQEAMSGLLAIVDASDSDYQKLAASIGNADGAAQSTADTMNDNLQGQFTIMKSALEGFGISLYQDVDNPLKDVVKDATGYINQLSDAFKNGGWDGLVSELGSVFSGIAVQAANAAPKMIDAAVSLIQSFLTGIQNNSEQLSDAAVNIVTSLINGIISLAPQIISAGGQLLLQFAQGFASQIPQLIVQAVNAIASLAQGLVDNIPTIIDTAVQVLLGFIQGLTQSLPQLIPIAINAILTLADSLIDHIDVIVDAGIQLILALAQGLIDALPTLIEKVPVIINKFFDAIDRNLPKILAAGVKLIIMLAKGIIQSIPVIVKNAGQIALAIFNIISHIDMLNLGKNLIKGLGNGIKSLFSWIKDAATGILKAIKTPFGHPGEILTNIGKQLIQGLWNGINSAKNWILDKVGGFMDDIVGGIKGFFGIHSPSKLMAEEIGRFLPPGITVGMDKAMPAMIRDMKSQLAGMIDQARSAITAEQAQVSAGFSAHATYQLAYSSAGGDSEDTAPVNFTQNNYSPKAITPAETARQTRNILRQARLKGK